MNKTTIEEELEAIISIPRSWDWDDGDCIRFTENLAKVLASLDQSQVGEMRSVIERIGESQVFRSWAEDTRQGS